MSQIRQGNPLLAVLLLLLLLSLTGCGSPNDSSSFNSAGGHPARWLPSGHKTAAIAGLESCTPCHGADYAGGVSGTSCSSCHMGGNASIHPAWGTPVYATHGSYVKSNGNDTSRCANAACHGTALTGVSGSGPSCTLCHMGSAVSIHPVEWNGNTLLHKTKVGFTNIESCKNTVCHGAALEGVPLSGPSCYICH
jgi:hypothetical protein